MKPVIATSYLDKKEKLDRIIETFDSSEDQILKEDRNTLKLFDVDGTLVNVKSFKVPNAFNQVIYKYFRKSKAQRSFEFANRLIKLQVGTPEPIAYYQDNSGLLFGRSYYISEQQDYDLTYRELTNDFAYPDYDAILRAFTRFTYSLHEKGVLFLDHSPGNTLIKKVGEDYNFYLVDLNRMEFKTLDFETRIKNFARLSTHKSMVEVMSDEYAKISGYNYDTIFNLMWKETEAFQEKFYRKRRLKKKLGLKDD